MRLPRIAFLLLALHASEAFVPRRRAGVLESALHMAKYLPPPPPPPPPVETLPEPTSNPFEALMKLPSLPSLEDLPSLQSLSTEDAKNLLRSLRELNLPELSLSSMVEDLAYDAMGQLVEKAPQLEPAADKFLQAFGPFVESPLVQLVSTALVTYLAASKLLSLALPPPPSQPYPLGKYDPIAARAYFDQRPVLVAARGLQILGQSLQFGLSLLKDKIDDKIAVNENQRGEELAALLTRLGPTFIKVGQSLSIRTDLLSPAYVRGLATLQDQVPAFDTATAKQILEAEWGQPVENVIDRLSDKPVAAASLGQVYRCRLKATGEEVAIKVQRPNINEQIALDMHLLREVAPIAKRLGNLNSDTVGTVDAWGAGFVDELDYLQEARNGAFFSERIKSTPLSDVVFAPTVLEEYSTQSVLVSEWVDGQRLDKSTSSDVTVLCSIAMNTYLTMMLELGVLHCDPHPGNLLRTPEGRLCILDWGMVTRLDKDLQLTLIEHMAHLTSADYEEIPRDLLLLGFIPPEKAGLIEDSGVVDVLADIYGAWTKGGGAAAINVNDVVNQLQDLTAKKGNLFQIPPYFAYIAKSFSVLEGIGLSNDAKYSIINECLPYVSKRLLTDKEKMGPALSTFIFGPSKKDTDRIVDYARVEQLVEGFGDYTTSASGALLGKDNVTRLELLDDAADQILDIVLTEEETPLQEIMLEQLAKVVTSGSRSVFTRIRERSGVLPSGRTVLGTIVDPLGLFRTSPLVRMNELDERTVDTTRKLFALFQKQIQDTRNPLFDTSNLTREEAIGLSSILARKVWSRRTSILMTGSRLARKIMELTAEKLERGERDSRRVPMRQESLPSARPQGLIEASEHTPNEHARLTEARRRLNAIESEELEPKLALPKAVPVRSD